MEKITDMSLSCFSSLTQQIEDLEASSYKITVPLRDIVTAAAQSQSNVTRQQEVLVGALVKCSCNIESLEVLRALSRIGEVTIDTLAEDIVVDWFSNILTSPLLPYVGISDTAFMRAKFELIRDDLVDRMTRALQRSADVA